QRLRYKVALDEVAAKSAEGFPARKNFDSFGHYPYSSLAHLKRLPVDELKIDRSFVQELELQTADDVILRSTINLGHALNLGNWLPNISGSGADSRLEPSTVWSPTSSSPRRNWPFDIDFTFASDRKAIYPARRPDAYPHRHR